ncbi:hypothetical protein [Maliponia aquimaris]|uniref:Antitoxin n=1 Tax=Maliponia aquimaris TaxID=1673631 RepID=A0A238KKV4_9RHOB|nr:hypothetical protein [Maliponia aquimaris]SMX43435.1 hypothetical protein MAA8898_02825 [Maliponia aquimaris]
MKYIEGTGFVASELSVADFRKEMALYLRRLEMQGGRYLLTRHGRVVGGLVSPWDVHALEEVDKRDKAERERRLQAHARHGNWLEEAREKARRGEDVEWSPRW